MVTYRQTDDRVTGTPVEASLRDGLIREDLDPCSGRQLEVNLVNLKLLHRKKEQERLNKKFRIIHGNLAFPNILLQNQQGP